MFEIAAGRDAPRTSAPARPTLSMSISPDPDARSRTVALSSTLILFSLASRAAIASASSRGPGRHCGPVRETNRRRGARSWMSHRRRGSPHSGVRGSGRRVPSKYPTIQRYDDPHPNISRSGRPESRTVTGERSRTGTLRVRIVTRSVPKGAARQNRELLAQCMAFGASPSLWIAPCRSRRPQTIAAAANMAAVHQNAVV